MQNQEKPQVGDVSPHTTIEINDVEVASVNDDSSSNFVDYNRIQSVAWGLLAANILFVMFPSIFLGSIVLFGAVLLFGVQLASFALSMTFDAYAKPIDHSSSFFKTHYYLAIFNTVLTASGLVIQFYGAYGNASNADDLLWASLIILGIVIPSLSALQLGFFAFSCWHLKYQMIQEQAVGAKTQSHMNTDDKTRSKVLSL